MNAKDLLGIGRRSERDYRVSTPLQDRVGWKLHHQATANCKSAVREVVARTRVSDNPLKGVGVVGGDKEKLRRMDNAVRLRCKSYAKVMKTVIVLP